MSGTFSPDVRTWDGSWPSGVGVGGRWNSFTGHLVIVPWSTVTTWVKPSISCGMRHVATINWMADACMRVRSICATICLLLVSSPAKGFSRIRRRGCLMSILAIWNRRNSPLERERINLSERLAIPNASYNCCPTLSPKEVGDRICPTVGRWCPSASIWLIRPWFHRSW